MKLKIVYILLTFFVQNLMAQDLSTFLSDKAQKNEKNYPNWVKLYAKGKYEQAYDAIKNNETDSLSYFNQFKSNSILYQRNFKIINEEHFQKNLISENYRFFRKFPEMEITLKDSTTVYLDGNLMSGRLMGNEEVKILFDTGGSGVGISKELVEKYGFERDTTIGTSSYLPAFNTSFTKHPTIIPKLQIGDMVLENIHATYGDIDTDSITTGNKPEFDIIIGLDIFINRIGQITFDWNLNKLIFEKEATLMKGIPFLFFESKPLTATRINDDYLTTVIDTGSPVDIMYEEYYLDVFTKKEQKKYGEFEYLEYTVEADLSDGSTLSLKIGDYNNLRLVMDGEKVPVLIGNKKQKLIFNLEKNVMQIN